MNIIMNQKRMRVVAEAIVFLFIMASQVAQAYQVWGGTCKTPNYVLDRFSEWDRVAEGVTGLNINFAPGGSLPGEAPNPEQWTQIMHTYATAYQNTYTELPRSNFESEYGSYGAGITLGETLQSQFDRASDWGYVIKAIMPYDILPAPDETIYWWVESELEDVRDWLDNHGHSDVAVFWNCRGDSDRERRFASNAAVAGIVMEARVHHWAEKESDRWSFLQWYTANYPNRDLIFQLPSDVADPYESTRRFVRSISADILGSTDFVRSDHCIIAPLTYQAFNTFWSFLSEHEPVGNRYGDSMTGLMLSLLEQEDLFTGTAPGGLISVADCSSFERTYDLRTAVTDGNLASSITWGQAIPLEGDANVWQSGSRALGSQNVPNYSTVTFHGETLVLQTGGVLTQHAYSTIFSMNNLVLDGGTIVHSALGSMTVKLNGDTLFLDSGEIQAGGQSSNQNIIFQDGKVVGEGTVDITAKGAGGSQVEFQSTVDLIDFSGTFDVSADGILNLPEIPVGSFGVKLSGSGRYRLDDDVIVTSLFIDGVEVPAGPYLLSDFSASQQDHLIDGGGTVHVCSDQTAIRDGKLNENLTWGVKLPKDTDNNTQVWKSGGNRLGVSTTAGVTHLFDGGELVIQTGGELAADVGLAGLWSRNLTLDGGTISNQKIFPFTIDLKGYTLTLNSGKLLADVGGSYDGDLIFKEGRLAGSGTIEIAGTGANDTPEVAFWDSMDMSGFSGTFLVTDHGVLKIDANTTSSFGITLTGSGKYTFNSNISVAQLTIDGVSLAPGIYYYDDFTPSQQAHLVETTGRIIVAGGLTVALMDGEINDPATWGGISPEFGDDNVWRSLDYTLRAGGAAYSTIPFNGHTLSLEPSGQLIPGTGGLTVQLNNLILDGGTIYNSRLFPFTVDLSGHQLILNSGTIMAGKATNDRDIVIRNGSLVGSGTIHIEAADAAGFEVEFQSTVNMSGFTGVFNVQSNGLLNLPAVTTATFGLNLSGTGKYVNDADVSLSSLIINGVTIAAGTYTYASFTAAQQAYLASPSGVISVVNVPFEQWTEDHELTLGMQGDEDGDGYLNYVEYAMDGDPNSPTNNGCVPSGSIVLDAGGDWFEVVHVERIESGPTPLKYTVEACSNLVSNLWKTEGIDLVGHGPINSAFNSVTNRVPMDGSDQQFIRIRIQ